MTSSYGVLNINKPLGFTSRHVVNLVQRLVKPAKAGHAGTLDPLASGVLVVCVGPATRLITFAQSGRKVYRAVFRFGVSSKTDDLESELEALPEAPLLTEEQVAAAMGAFLGKIEQVPPVYSAVWVNGQRAYDLSRRGETINLSSRVVQIDRFELRKFDPRAQELTAIIECGAGTYIRSLGRDLGRSLGSAAVMTQLERCSVGPFDIAQAVDPELLTAENLHEYLSPAAGLLSAERQLICSESETVAIRSGRAIPKPLDERFEADEKVVLFSPQNALVAITVFNAADATLKPKIVMPV